MKEEIEEVAIKYSHEHNSCPNIKSYDCEQHLTYGLKNGFIAGVEYAQKMFSSYKKHVLQSYCNCCKHSDIGKDIHCNQKYDECPFIYDFIVELEKGKNYGK